MDVNYNMVPTGTKIANNTVTIATGNNANGSCRLPLFIIGK